MKNVPCHVCCRPSASTRGDGISLCDVCLGPTAARSPGPVDGGVYVPDANVLMPAGGPPLFLAHLRNPSTHVMHRGPFSKTLCGQDITFINDNSVPDEKTAKLWCTEGAPSGTKYRPCDRCFPGMRATIIGDGLHERMLNDSEVEVALRELVIDIVDPSPRPGTRKSAHRASMGAEKTDCGLDATSAMRVSFVIHDMGDPQIKQSVKKAVLDGKCVPCAGCWPMVPRISMLHVRTVPASPGTYSNVTVCGLMTDLFFYSDGNSTARYWDPAFVATEVSRAKANKSHSFCQTCLPGEGH